MATERPGVSGGGQNEKKRGFALTADIKLSRHIEEWNERGLGRAIGFMAPPETSNDRPQFQGAFYTLPLTDLTDSSIPGVNHRVLLIAPQETQARFLILRPKQYRADLSEQHDPQKTQLRMKVNKALIDQFRRFFQPNTIAHLDKSLGPDPTQALGKFSGTESPLGRFVVKDKEIFGAEKEPVLEQALQTAHRIEAAKNANSETALVNIVGAAGVAALGKYTTIFEQDMRDEAVLLGSFGDDVVEALSETSDLFAMARSARAARQAEVTDLFRGRVSSMTGDQVKAALDSLELDFPTPEIGDSDESS